MASLKDMMDLLIFAWRWLQCRKNPARAQAARVLRVYGAHGIQPIQINRLLPEELRLPAIQWSTADYLKDVLSQRHIDWINEYFALDPRWLDGVSESPHKVLPSYKEPRALYEWLQVYNPHNDLGNFKVHLVMADGSEIGPQTHGDFAVFLELFAKNEKEPSQYYHLTDGAHFSHLACVLHLMQILAISHASGAIMQRSTIVRTALMTLRGNVGFIPNILAKCRPHRLAADHELWAHYSGSTPWLFQLRADLESSLVRAGISDVVDRVQADGQMWARN